MDQLIEANPRLTRDAVQAALAFAAEALRAAPAPRRRIELKGAGGRPVTVHLDDEWLGLDAGLPIPLYVGKTHGSVARRPGQHLRLKDVRTRLEDTRPLVLDNVGLSEDCAVGLVRPGLNIDIER